MDGTHETSTDTFEDGPLSPTLFGAMAGGFDIVVFTIIGRMTFGDPVLGGIAGLLVGLGVFLFLPLFMLSSESGGLEAMAPADDGAPLRGFHRLAAGLACSAAGLLVFTWGFIESDLVVGLPAALLAGGVVYLGAGFLLPNARL